VIANLPAILPELALGIEESTPRFTEAVEAGYWRRMRRVPPYSEECST